MHFGILCSDLPLVELMERLRRFGGEVLDRGPVSDPNAFDPSPSEGNALIGGERAGKAYVMDSSLLVSGAEPDLVVAVASVAPAALVVGCGAETVSGTYWLTAARGAEVLRSYFHCHSDLSRPFERGSPLATEGKQPLDGDPDGRGLTAALGSLGFDFDSWFRSGPWTAFLYTGEGADPPSTKGLLGEAQSVHHLQFQIPAGEQPTLKVIARAKSGAVIDVRDTGIRLGHTGGPGKGKIWRAVNRLRGRG